MTQDQSIPLNNPHVISEDIAGTNILNGLYFQTGFDHMCKTDGGELTHAEFLVYHIVGASNIPSDKVNMAAGAVFDMLTSLIEDGDVGFVKYAEEFDYVNDFPNWIWVAMLGHLPFFAKTAQNVLQTPKVSVPRPLPRGFGSPAPTRALDWDEAEFNTDGIDPDIHRKSVYAFCKANKIGA